MYFRENKEVTELFDIIHLMKFFKIIVAKQMFQSKSKYITIEKT